MPRKSFIDRIKVKDPCTQDWETMRGNDTVRFCDHCWKNVTDISTMTRKRAMKVVRKSKGSLCVRYLEEPRDHSAMFADRLTSLTRRAPSLATGAIGASLVLSTAAYAQGPVGQRAPQPQISNQEKSPTQKSKKPASPDLTAEISGTVTDPIGAVVPGAVVKVMNTETRTQRSTITNDEGKYSIRDLAFAKYEVSISSPGFKVHQTSELDVAQGKGSKLDITLEVGSLTMGGVMFSGSDYESPISKAIDDDDIDALQEAIAAGANINFKEKENGKITPLFVAVDNGNIEMARMLLNLGAKVNARDSLRQTPLMRLYDDSDAVMVELLLQHGAKINLGDKQGNTALILAAENASAEVVEVLLKGSADVNSANKDGQTALMNAAYEDDLEMVRLLLNAGADVNAKNEEGETALDQTSEQEIKDLLVSFGAVTKDKDDPVDEVESSEHSVSVNS